jgi:hypothetical protein
MKTELHNYDIFPKVIQAGKESQITVKPLGWHSAFEKDKNYTVSICPLHEGYRGDYPERRNFINFEVTPDSDGCIRFKFEFFSEQQYYIRIKSETFYTQLSVYAVNKDLCGRYPFKGDLHVHSRYSDGQQSPAIVCANYRKTGYDFMAITDHSQYYPSLEAIEVYKNAPIELTIIPGEEIHAPPINNRNLTDIHIVNFGGEYSVNELIGRILNADDKKSRDKLADEFYKKAKKYAESLNIPEGMNETEKLSYAACHWIFEEIRKANGLGIFCHPYWISDVFQVPPEFTDYMMQEQPFDAFEVLGGDVVFEMNGFQTIQYYEDLAKGRKYPIVGSTDSHNSVNSRVSHVCSTIVFSPENEKTALISSIKDFYSVAVDTLSAEPRYVGSLRLVKYACFLEQEFFPLHDDLCYEEGRAMKDYACGVDGADKILSVLYGRMKAQREKYFGFHHG